MDEYDIMELEELSEELGIEKEDFIKIVGYAKYYKKHENPDITDTVLEGVIREALMLFDSRFNKEEEQDVGESLAIKDINKRRKNIPQCFEEALFRCDVETRKR